MSEFENKEFQKEAETAESKVADKSKAVQNPKKLTDDQIREMIQDGNPKKSFDGDKYFFLGRKILVLGLLVYFFTFMFFSVFSMIPQNAYLISYENLAKNFCLYSLCMLSLFILLNWKYKVSGINLFSVIAACYYLWSLVTEVISLVSVASVSKVFAAGYFLLAALSCILLISAKLKLRSLKRALFLFSVLFGILHITGVIMDGNITQVQAAEITETTGNIMFFLMMAFMALSIESEKAAYYYYDGSF